MRLRAVLAGLTAVLSACANISSDYKFDAKKPEGLIVGSITYERSIGLYGLVLEAPAGVEVPRIQVGSSMWPALSPLYDEALKAKGGTFAVAVPEGRYKIRSWFVKEGAFVTEPTAPIDIVLTVERGKATYLGNLHFTQSRVAALRDRASRDIPVLETRYSVLKTAPVSFTIETNADLQGVGGRALRSFQPPAYIPIVVPVR